MGASKIMCTTCSAALIAEKLSNTKRDRSIGLEGVIKPKTILKGSSAYST